MGFKTINKKVPCFNCSNRSMTCHADYERYLSYRKERETNNQNIYRQRMERNVIDEYAIAQQEKRRRRTGNVR